MDVPPREDRADKAAPLLETARGAAASGDFVYAVAALQRCLDSLRLHATSGELAEAQWLAEDIAAAATGEARDEALLVAYEVGMLSERRDEEARQSGSPRSLWSGAPHEEDTLEDRVCPRCGASVGVGQKFCSNCGGQLPARSLLPTREGWSVGDAPVPQARALKPAPVDSTSAAPEQAARGWRPARSPRDSLLGSAGLVLAVGGIVAAAGAALLLIEELQSHDLAGYSVAVGLDLLGFVLLVAAFSVAGAVFLSRRPKSGGLATAAVLAECALAAQLAGHVIQATMDAVHDASKTVVASESALSAASLLVFVAFIVSASGFFRAIRGGAALRDSRLGWASIVLAVAFAFLMTSDILLVVALSDLDATGSITASRGVSAGGDGVAMVGAIVAAVAFLLSSARNRSGQLHWRAARDGLLALAAAIFATAFVVIGVGAAIWAGEFSHSGIGKLEAAYWLFASQWFVFSVGGVCATIGFILSRRLSPDAGTATNYAP